MIKQIMNKYKEMVKADIRFRRGTKIKLKSLLEAEPGFTIDEKSLYIGSSNGNVKFLNEEQTKKSHYLKEETYTKIEIDEKVLSATATAKEVFKKDILISDWITDEATGVKTCTILHEKNIPIENLNIEFYQSNEAVLIGYKYIDNNNVEITSDSDEEVTVFISNMNEAGPQGLTGPKGEDGAVGPQGPTGERYALPPATTDVLGGIKVGANLSIDADGVLNAEVGNQVAQTSSTLGGESTTITKVGEVYSSTNSMIKRIIFDDETMTLTVNHTVGNKKILSNLISDKYLKFEIVEATDNQFKIRFYRDSNIHSYIKYVDGAWKLVPTSEYGIEETDFSWDSTYSCLIVDHAPIKISGFNTSIEPFGGTYNKPGNYSTNIRSIDETVTKICFYNENSLVTTQSDRMAVILNRWSNPNINIKPSEDFTFDVIVVEDTKASLRDYYTKIQTDANIEKKADKIHTHTKTEITDFPTSLPADGGNADTLKGYSPEDFLSTEGGLVRGDVRTEGSFYARRYMQLEAKGDGIGVMSSYFDNLNNEKELCFDNVSNMKLGVSKVYHEDFKPSATDINFTDGQTFQEKLDAGLLKGDKGNVGTTGAIGQTGSNGSQGVPGVNGTNGADGKDGDPLQIENSFNGGTTKALSAEKGKELNTQTAKNANSIKELEDLTPVWQNQSGIENITVQDSFDGVVKDCIIKGKTLKNLSIINKEHVSEGAQYRSIKLADIKPNTKYTLKFNLEGVKVGLKTSEDVVIVSEIPLGDSIIHITTPNIATGLVFIVLNTTKLTINGMMILEGESPNPPSQHFDSITSCGEQEGNKVVVKSCGENLFKLCIENVIGQGVLEGNVVISTMNIGPVVRFDNLIIGAEYILSSDISHNAPPSGGQLAWAVQTTDTYYNGTNLVKIATGNSLRVDCKFIATTTSVYLVGSVKGSRISNIQLVEGTIAKEYVPYQEVINQVSLPFVGGLKGLSPEICDYIDEEKKEIVQKIVTLDISNINYIPYNRPYHSDLICFHTEEIANISKDISMHGSGDIVCNCISTLLPPISADNDMETNREAIYPWTNGRLYIKILKSRLKTQDIAGLKLFLKENKGVALLKLAESIIHPLNNYITPTTFAGTTHVTQENNLVGEMSFKVAQDRDALINNNSLEINEIKQELEQTFDCLAGKTPVYLEKNWNDNLSLDNTLYGDIRELEIKGKTLKNLCTVSKGTLTITKGGYFADAMVCRTSGIKLNTVYTMIVKVTSKGATPETMNRFEWGIGTSPSVVSDHPLVNIGYSTHIYNMNKDGIYSAPISFNDFKGMEYLVARPWRSQVPIDITLTFEYEMLFLEGDYTNQPIPSYFEGISNTGDKEENKISVLSCGENLIPRWESGQFSDLTGAETPSENVRTPFIKVDSGCEYISNNGLWFFEYDGTKRFIKRYLLNGGISTTLSNSTEYIRVFRSVPDSAITSLVKGNIRPSYTPYTQDKKEIILPMLDGLKGLPNGASDIWRMNRGEVVQNVRKIVLNGSENWVSDDVGVKTVRFRLYLNPIAEDYQFFSDKFKYLYNTGVDEEYIGTVTSNGAYLRVPKSVLAAPDVASFKNWLQTNNVELLYGLKTPIIHKVEPVILKTQPNQTNIFQENNIQGDKTALIPINLSSSLDQVNKLKQENQNLRQAQVGVLDTLINFYSMTVLPDETQEEHPLVGGLLNIRKDLNNI